MYISLHLNVDFCLISLHNIFPVGVLYVCFNLAFNFPSLSFQGVRDLILVIMCLLVAIIIINYYYYNYYDGGDGNEELRHGLTKSGRIALNCDLPSSVSLLARKLACATKPAFSISLL